MSNSLVFYLDRTNTVQIIDPDNLPRAEDRNPLQLLVIDVINAGYKGVVIDEQRLSDGRFFQAISVNEASPEGQILNTLSADYKSGKPLPPAVNVLQQIRDAYAVERSYKRGD